ncbi:hypothetical protein IID22_04950, partial [Patescibacteria group bacterium]|nr:hypothetical protein [Patescibacteria group bacterium]
MGFLERLNQSLVEQTEKSKARIATKKEYQQWIRANPDIRREVDRLNGEALLSEKKAGVAAAVAMSSAAAQPVAGLIFAAESGRQWKKGSDALKSRDKLIRE